MLPGMGSSILRPFHSDGPRAGEAHAHDYALSGCNQRWLDQRNSWLDWDWDKRSLSITAIELVRQKKNSSLRHGPRRSPPFSQATYSQKMPANSVPVSATVKTGVRRRLHF
jgi:hypothetical protein